VQTFYSHEVVKAKLAGLYEQEFAASQVRGA